LVLVLSVITVFETWRGHVHVRGERPEPRARSIAAAAVGFAFIVGPFLVLMTLGSMLPTIDFDALEYHLQGPKEYFRAGQITFLSHNVYTSMPFGVEMLHLLGMVLLGDWWRGALAGQLVVMLCAPAAAALVGSAAARLGTPQAGWFAAAVYLTTPWVFRLAAIPYVEGVLCLFHAALVLSGILAWRELDPRLRVRLWIFCGLLAGGAMSCKYPALVSAIVPFGLAVVACAALWKSPREALGFVLGVVVVIGPWLVKNLAETGNPVYPLAWGIFGGRDWDAASDAKWRAAHGPKAVTWPELAKGVMDVAGRSDWQSPLYLALVPLAFLRHEWRRAAAVLLGYAGYLFATWWLLTHRIDRFWIPILPALAILAGLGACWSRRLGWKLVLWPVFLLAVATNLTYVTTSLAGLNEWTSDYDELRERVPEMLNAPLARLDRELPEDAMVLLVGQAAVFHLDHEVVYNTVFDLEVFEELARGRTPAEVHRELVSRGITHVYVDWPEIDRHRKPGGYGFTDFIVPARFEELVVAGVLAPLPATGPDRALFGVRALPQTPDDLSR
jgi:4-amino-4-deoxy-L-arabinose transferase-like glycosyltransferase